MRLLAKISDADLFIKMLNELGVAFYRKVAVSYTHLTLPTKA